MLALRLPPEIEAQLDDLAKRYRAQQKLLRAHRHS